MIEDNKQLFSKASLETAIAAYKLGKPTYFQMNQNMFLSKFFNYEKLDANNYAIFNTLLMDVLVVNENEFENIKNMKMIDDLDKDLLIKKGIYVRDEEVDNKALAILQESYMATTCEIGVMYLILTTACNLACKYCFINNYSHKKIDETIMSKDTAINALKLFEHHLKETHNKQGKVILYGGEPTINWDVLNEIVLRVKDKDYKILLITNGILLDEKKIDFLVDNNVEIGVSIDGPEFINDANRVNKDGIGSYKDVLFAIQILKLKNANFNLSITISNSILENKDIVIKWLSDIKVENIFFNLLHFSSYDKDWESYQIKACDFLIEAFEILNPIGIHDGRIARKLENYLNNSFRFIDCAACGANQVTVKPNGSICICQCCSKSNDYEIGSIHTNSFSEIANSEEMIFWKNSAAILKDECLKCKALFICGGGCPMQSQALFGNRGEIDQTACIHSKTALSWLLKKNYLLEKKGVEL